MNMARAGSAEKNLDAKSSKMPAPPAKKFMLKALGLAARGEGRVSPNPLVGAVIVKGGRVVGRGWHRGYGGAHAEANAIADAGAKARGGALFVTLEPCNHFGLQPPCTKAIIDAGIAKVFAAIRDPNPVSQNGAAELERNGIPVRFGICRKEAEKQNEFYIKSLALRRPFIALKIAMSRDGFITYGDGKSKRISGKASRAFVQQLRKKFDAILVGANTIHKDNPRLTCRENPALNPTRIILDSLARTPPGSMVFSQEGETIVVCTKKAPQKNRAALLARGAAVVVAPEKGGMVELKWLMKNLHSRGIRSVMVEPGNRTATSFLQAGLFERIYITVSGKAIENGLKAFSLKKSIAVKSAGAIKLGTDTLISLEKK